MPRQSTATSEKSAAKPVKSSKSKDASTGQSAAKKEDIHDLIATAAYYRAEHRGFNGGNEMEDWLEAEVEINTKLHH